MPVVGTAGHVDHGKTALILALTGIDTDRLPEEKARGMTTDLGFAHFEAAGIGPIGVVDVPGHERFIRNMVAGASSIDGAVLVVAADDGWMEQTGRHLEVLKAFGVPILAVAVTKADLAPVERSEAVGADALRRIALAFGLTGGMEPSPPPVIAVDALRGTGISLLREAIARAVVRLPRPAEVFTQACLNVDRSFTLRGPGLVVAGSLRGGRVLKGSELLLLPAGELVRVRELQCYGRSVDSAKAGSRVALAISRPKTDPRRGDRLVDPASPSVSMRSFYAAIEGISRGTKFRPGFELELAIGTAHRDARVWPSRKEGFLRVAVDEAVAACPGEPILFLRRGGADVLASALILAPGGESAAKRREMDRSIAELESNIGSQHGADLPRRFRIALDGYLLLSPGEIAPQGIETAGGYAVSPARWKAAVAALESASAEPGGLPENSLPGRLHLPLELAKAIAAHLEAEGKLRRRAGSILGAESESRAGADLPASAELLLSTIKKAGTEGFEHPEPAYPGFGKDLGLLCRAGLVVGLDSRLFLSREAYDELIVQLLAGRKAGTCFSVPDAKAATGFSRKWILPFLNSAENNGWVRREGDLRKVAREVPPLQDSPSPP